NNRNDFGFDGASNNRNDFGFDGAPNNRNDFGFDGAPNSQNDLGFDGAPNSQNDFGFDGAPNNRNDFGFDGAPNSQNDFGFDGSQNSPNDFGFDGQSSNPNDFGYEDASGNPDYAGNNPEYEGREYDQNPGSIPPTRVNDFNYGRYPERPRKRAENNTNYRNPDYDEEPRPPKKGKGKGGSRKDRNQNPDKEKDPIGTALFIIVIILVILFLLIGGMLLLSYFMKEDSSGNNDSLQSTEMDAGEMDEALGSAGPGEKESQDSDDESPFQSGDQNNNPSRPSENPFTEESSEATDERDDNSRDSEEKENAIHRYEIFIGDVSWSEANEKCRQKGGYLARINTEEEFNLITKAIKDGGKERNLYWIGAGRASNSKDYYWIDGDKNPIGDPINNSRHWLPGEPTFTDKGSGKEETCVDLIYRNSEHSFFINDVPDDILSVVSSYKGRIGYICEYED
ncbi:MAG: C-type lectin domain-containing protein, partial [Lachnospiraceae bacterium]|nr:C-type lectin domain-containing protein [Lachnospiraceae bacterium]